MGLVSQPNEIFNLEDIKRKALVSNQTIVSYFVGAKTVYQFIISKEKIAFKKLVNSEIDFNDFLESIRSYNHFFNNPNTINNDIPLFAKTSLTLFKRLQLPKAENLIIIPDGILVFVPFQTLLTKKTQTFQYSEMPFLLFESKIAYAVSLRMYCKKTIPFEENQSVLGVFPVFKNTPQELSYSIFEAEAIANLFPTELLMESQASATAFIGKAKKHSILHISTHALGGTFSSDPSIQFYDRSLSIEELYGLNLKSQLVILSACDTGIGKVIKGEGALSLARSFQYAGASNILFSLWQVNDKSTAQLMEYYYQNLKQTHSRNFSLHLANLDYLKDETIDNSRKSPYFWGAFIYYGTTDVPKHNDNQNWAFWLLIFVFVGGVTFWFFRRKRN
jgi:CHAT domain-containing protein